MRLKLVRLSGFVGLLIWTSGAASAHHSLSAEYDPNKPILLKGSVTDIEWSNPHARVHISVRDFNGKMVNWELELGSPNALARRGWTRKALNPGEKITVTAFLARDGSKLASVRTLKMADGRVLLGPPDSLFEP
jgi:hypothetical protein